VSIIKPAQRHKYNTKQNTKSTKNNRTEKSNEILGQKHLNPEKNIDKLVLNVTD
jgi:hypothetical protein